jgi:hypothetical protein
MHAAAESVETFMPIVLINLWLNDSSVTFLHQYCALLIVNAGIPNSTVYVLTPARYSPMNHQT